MWLSLNSRKYVSQLSLLVSTADTDSAAAYQAYLSYTSGSATYTAFVNAQTTASSNLNNVKTDLARLNGSPDSTRMSAASTVAQQIVTEQGITALPDPSVSSAHGLRFTSAYSCMA